jgi:hypothetical protein
MQSKYAAKPYPIYKSFVHRGLSASDGTVNRTIAELKEGKTVVLCGYKWVPVLGKGSRKGEVFARVHRLRSQATPANDDGPISYTTRLSSKRT